MRFDCNQTSFSRHVPFFKDAFQPTDAFVHGGHIDDVAPAKAGAPKTDTVGIDTRFTGKKVYAVDDVFGLIKRVHQLSNSLHPSCDQPAFIRLRWNMASSRLSICALLAPVAPYKIVPVEKVRGAVMMPALVISLAAKILCVWLLGS